MIKKIGIGKIVLTCISALIFIAGIICVFVLPRGKEYSDYYFYKDSNNQDSQAKVEVYIKDGKFYTVTTDWKGDEVTSDKVSYFVRDGRIFLDVTEDEYEKLSAEEKSAIFSYEINEKELFYPLLSGETGEVERFLGNVKLDEFGEPIDYGFGGLRTTLSLVIPLIVVLFGLVGTLVGTTQIASAVVKIKRENNPNAAQKPKKQKFSLKSLHNKITVKSLISMAVTVAVLVTAGSILASGKYATHMGSYSLDDANLPKEIRDAGNHNYKIKFTKKGVYTVYETTEHYIVSETTPYIVKGGRLFLDTTEEEYKEFIKELKELDATKEERDEMLELLSEDISTLEYTTLIDGSLKAMTFKSTTGFVLQIVGYVLLGIAAISFIELLVALSQKFVYLLVVSRSDIPENLAVAGASATTSGTQDVESAATEAERATAPEEAKTEPTENTEPKLAEEKPEETATEPKPAAEKTEEKASKPAPKPRKSKMTTDKAAEPTEAPKAEKEAKDEADTKKNKKNNKN